MILFYLCSVIVFASLVQTELVSLPGCPAKCGNLTIPYPFGLNSECYFDDSFHIICNTSFEPPKPILRVGSAQVVNISLDGKLEVFNSSSSGLEKTVVAWAFGNGACHVARNNVSHYACQSSHSVCTDSSAGQGYACRCLPGYQGNPYLVDGCQDIDECGVSNPCEGVCINLEGSFKCYCPQGLVGDGKKDGTGCHPQIGINWSLFPLGIVVVAPVMAGTWIIWIDRQKKMEKLREELFEKNGGNLLKHKLSRRRDPHLIRIYTAEDMKSITNTYHSSNIMRRCTPGAFFRGTLCNGDDDDGNVEVAVVMVKRVAQSQIEQFVDQLILLSQPHKNLLRIIGCCLETRSPFIVYELHGTGNATLFDCIRRREMDSPFSCATRVKAAAGVARGLAYLNTKFVHGNICSANIVMDSSNDAKIFYSAGSNLITCDATSSDWETYVYKDPEPLNKKSDVYSFGVVSVELLTGGRTISRNRRENCRNMALDFVFLSRAGRLREILDEEMIAETDAEVVMEIAKLAERCLNVKPSKRPNMKEVAAKLSTLMQRG